MVDLSDSPVTSVRPDEAERRASTAPRFSPANDPKGYHLTWESVKTA